MDTVAVAIIGAGPAGLMAAECLAEKGMTVDVYDAMPSFGRKFLLAGIGGLNITHSEPYPTFCSRFGDRQEQLQIILDQFPPEVLRQWVSGLGIKTFVGSSGRVFPEEMKAAPLLRAWLQRLRANGVRFHPRHRWVGWSKTGEMVFNFKNEVVQIRPQASIFALGGGSWPKLGSDGAWVNLFKERNIDVAPLQSANCGFDTTWSDYLREKYSGAPLKSVALSFMDVLGRYETRRGELVISSTGVEGSLIYAFSRKIRESLNAHGHATLLLDLLPAREKDWVFSEVKRPRGSRSMSSHLQSRLGINGVKLALLHEVLSKTQFADLDQLATTIKALPIAVHATRPIEEAISSAGGVCFSGLDKNLMLARLPGTFVAGEMVDWEAPTGGYLLTACFAMGRHVAHAAAEWLKQRGGAG